MNVGIINVSEHQDLIARAAHIQLAGIVKSHQVTGRNDWAIRGKTGEAIAAMAYGIPVGSILEDGPGHPDLVKEGEPLDVKGVPRLAQSVNLRTSSLRHTSWRLVIVRVHGWTGWIIGTARVLDVVRMQLPVHQPVPGEKSPYVTLPLTSLERTA